MRSLSKSRDSIPWHPPFLHADGTRRRQLTIRRHARCRQDCSSGATRPHQTRPCRTRFPPGHFEALGAARKRWRRFQGIVFSRRKIADGAWNVKARAGYLLYSGQSRRRSCGANGRHERETHPFMPGLALSGLGFPFPLRVRHRNFPCLQIIVASLALADTEWENYGACVGTAPLDRYGDVVEGVARCGPVRPRDTRRSGARIQ